MSYVKRKEILVVIFCLFIGFGLRFYTFDQKSLWMDEIHTFNDSRYGFKDQLKFYQEKPNYLHPPLFFILTHLFHPFNKPERDLRMIPLIFGTLSIIMIYFLARLFSPRIAFPCAFSLAFMAYHISISQDGRSYALLMFLGLTGLYLFLKHLQTSKWRFLIPAALFFAILIHTSYSSIPFIIFTQVLWLYHVHGEKRKPSFYPFLIFNGTILLFCLPWIIFVALHYYRGRIPMDLFHGEAARSLGAIFYGIFHDWAPHPPLLIISIMLMLLYPIFSKRRENALILLTIFVTPIIGLYMYCKLFSITHFMTSRYLVSFLPLFLITLYLSLEDIESTFQRLKGFMRLKFLFTLLFVASNLIILPSYYRSEKQDFRGLVGYLKGHLRAGDKIFDLETSSTLGMLHYFGAKPEGRHFILDTLRPTEEGLEYTKSFIYQGRKFVIYHSKDCCSRYREKGSRLWIIAGTKAAKSFERDPLIVRKAYFDGSFSNFVRFPTDASMYLFLWDPETSIEKRIDLRIE